MKVNLFYSVVCLVVGIVFYACKGPQGDIGPTGPTGNVGSMGVGGPAGTVGPAGTTGTTGTAGTTGPAGETGQPGATGPQGPTGNANVVYSAWIAPAWVSGGDATNGAFFKQKSDANALLTQDVIDKGIVYAYVKVKALDYDQDKSEYKLVERIVPNSGTASFKIPGRQTNNFYDYGNSYIYVDQQIGVNFLRVTAQLDKRGYKDANYVLGILPELAGKSFTFYNDLTKDLYQYRIVIVNGSTKGRQAAVDMKDYAAVKKAFNLKD